MPQPILPEVEGLNEHQVATLTYCRGYKQFLSMLEGYRAGVCVFCKLDPVKNRVIRTATSGNMRWHMWVNPFPLPHTALHLISAPVHHVAPGDLITLDDMTAKGELFLWAQQEYKLTGGGVAMRFGSPFESSGTVLHLHENIIVPSRTGVVEVTLAKEPSKIAEQIARLLVFLKLSRGVTSADLTPEELALIEGRV